MIAGIKKHRSEFLHDHPGASIEAFYKLIPPLLHDATVIEKAYRLRP
jgi:hypothetical protein